MRAFTPPGLATEGSLGARACQIRRRRGPPPAHPHALNGAAASAASPVSAGIQEHTQAQGVTRTTPLIPLQQGRPKIEAPKFETRRRQLPTGLTFARTEQEQTSPSRVRPATPRLSSCQQRGASRRYRGPVVDNLRRAFFLPPARTAGNLRTPHRVRTADAPPGPPRTGVYQGTTLKARSPTPSRASFLPARPNKMRRLRRHGKTLR